MGFDPLTNISYEHRKNWIQERLTALADIFTIEIGGYAIMSNHYHLNVKTRPDLTEKLSDREIAHRWFLLFPPKIKKGITSAKDQIAAHLFNLLERPEKIETYRERIGSLSWFMKSLNEFIARKGNLENNRTGRFWEGRYKSKLLTTMEATLITHYRDGCPLLLFCSCKTSRKTIRFYLLIMSQLHRTLN